VVDVASSKMIEEEERLDGEQAQFARPKAFDKVYS
jgi:hypothetical protein